LTSNYAGIDWSGDKHDVVISDAAGGRLLASTFAHDEAGIRSLCSTLARLGVELVGIERPDGLLVERLLDAGLRVLPLHPNQVVAARSRFRASGGKSDRFDASGGTDQPVARHAVAVLGRPGRTVYRPRQSDLAGLP
jgi:hypothetical protein